MKNARTLIASIVATLMLTGCGAEANKMSHDASSIEPSAGLLENSTPPASETNLDNLEHTTATEASTEITTTDEETTSVLLSAVPPTPVTETETSSSSSTQLSGQANIKPTQKPDTTKPSKPANNSQTETNNVVDTSTPPETSTIDTTIQTTVATTTDTSTAESSSTDTSSNDNGTVAETTTDAAIANDAPAESTASEPELIADSESTQTSDASAEASTENTASSDTASDFHWDMSAETTTDTTDTAQNEAISNNATLQWDIPRARANGDALQINELGGYEIRYHNRLTQQHETRIVNDPFATEVVFEQLSSGEWEFTIAAFDTNGIYSPFSSPVVKVIN